MINKQNKKGLGAPSFTVIMLVIFIIMGLAISQNHISTKDANSLIDSLNWTEIGKNVSLSIQNAADSNPNYYAKVVLNIANKAVDFFRYTTMEVAKVTIKTAKDNPDTINYRTLSVLLILSLAAPILYPAFVSIISLILIIKEWYQNRKEKKEKKKLEGLERQKR